MNKERRAELTALTRAAMGEDSTADLIDLEGCGCCSSAGQGVRALAAELRLSELLELLEGKAQ